MKDNRKMEANILKLREYVADLTPSNIGTYKQYKDRFYKSLEFRPDEVEEMYLNQLLFDNWNDINDTGII